MILRPRSISKNEGVKFNSAILPHPDPLPLGEGTAFVSECFSKARPPDSDSGNHQRQTSILPLPAGEGRGEGEPSALATLLNN